MVPAMLFTCELKSDHPEGLNSIRDTQEQGPVVLCPQNTRVSSIFLFCIVQLEHVKTLANLRARNAFPTM